MNNQTLRFFTFFARLATLAGLLLTLPFAAGCIGGMPPATDAATPVVRGDRVFVNQAGSTVVTDARSGAILRTLPGAASPQTPPAVVGSVVYGGHHDIRAFDVATGLEVWTVPVRPGATAQHLVVDEGHVYFQSATAGDCQLVALDRLTGRQLWSVPTPRPEVITPAGDVVLVTDYRSVIHGKIVARDAGTGADRWVAENNTMRPMVFAAGRLFIHGDGHARELDPATGADRWRDANDDNVYLAADVRAGAGMLYTAQGSRVRALDLATKVVRWTAPCSGQLVTGGGLVACARGSSIVAYRGDTGAAAWKVALPFRLWTAPVISEGMVVVHGYPAALLALDATTGAQRFRRDLATGALISPDVLDLLEDGSVVHHGVKVSLEEVTRCDPAAHAAAEKSRRIEITGYVFTGVGLVGALVSSVMVALSNPTKASLGTLFTAGAVGDATSLGFLSGGFAIVMAARSSADEAVRLYNASPRCMGTR